MKIFLLLILLSLNCHAGNWVKKSKILASSNEGYQMKADCEKSGEVNLLEHCFTINYATSCRTRQLLCASI